MEMTNATLGATDQVLSVLSLDIGSQNASLRNLQTASQEIAKRTDILCHLESISELTGGFVHLLPEFAYLPALLDANRDPVFLYQLVESLEEYLDMDALLAEFPLLQYSQIAGALEFLRGVSQINSRELDIDAFEDAFDADVMDEVREALTRKEEIANVFADA